VADNGVRVQLILIEIGKDLTHFVIQTVVLVFLQKLKEHLASLDWLVVFEKILSEVGQNVRGDLAISLKDRLGHTRAWNSEGPVTVRSPDLLMLRDG
jgi:hypothetical protein